MRYFVEIEHVRPSPEDGGLWKRDLTCDDFEMLEGALLLKGVDGGFNQAVVPLTNVAALFFSEAKE